MRLETLETHGQLAEFRSESSDSPARAARFLKSLAHPDRLRVLCDLLDGEQSVAQIEAKVGASQSAISQHLARLKEEGIVKSRRVGRQILYQISDEIALGILELLYQRFCDPEGSPDIHTDG